MFLYSRVKFRLLSQSNKLAETFNDTAEREAAFAEHVRCQLANISRDIGAKDSTKSQLIELRERNAILQRQLEDEQGDKEQLQKSLEAVQSEERILTSRIAELERIISGLEERQANQERRTAIHTSELEMENSGLKKQLEDREKRLSEYSAEDESMNKLEQEVKAQAESFQVRLNLNWGPRANLMPGAYTGT